MKTIDELKKDGEKLLKNKKPIVPTYYMFSDDEVIIFDIDGIREEFEQNIKILDEHNVEVFDMEEVMEDEEMN
jgi:hypothetical protein